MSSLVTDLDSATAQEIVSWVMTADGCVHSADRTQLDFAVGTFVQTRRDCHQLVANVYTPLTRQLSRVGVGAVCTGHERRRRGNVYSWPV